MGSSSRTRTQTQSSTTNQQISTGQELQDDAVGVVGDDNEVSITRTDYGAIESGLTAMLDAGNLASAVAQDNADISREAIMGARDSLETSLSYSGDAMAESLRVASDVMNESGVNILDAARMANETAQYSVDTATEAALSGAGMGLDTANESMRLLSDTAGSALSFNDSQSERLANAVTDTAESALLFNDSQSERLANAVTDASDSALMFADSQNERLASTLGDNSALTQQALLELSERQERGLDSALDVAESVAMNDNVEGANTQTKYFALAAAAIGVAWALRAKA